ncbi:MAG TPA: Cys-tRNA(Pro) deacylase [Candidatus Faecaligallichristensenella faecipullorum]|nr:Cys-tRNA(Pro) deacylase [Candidatus Faecaligallichristensenella faecipullorum]
MSELKTNAMRILDAMRVSYQLHTYEPGESVDGVSVATKMGMDVNKVYKTLVTQGKGGGFFVFVIPVARELDLKKAARAAGEKSVEMIPVKEINRHTGYIRGGCSPVGMKKKYPTFIDESARALPAMVVSGGRIGLQMEIAPEDLARSVGAHFADLLR